LTKRVRGFSDLSNIVNKSIFQTLARSINTVLTVVIAALALLIFGNEAIRNFAFALTVGLVAGTYSSIFIAAQLWAIWKARALKRTQSKPKEA
ncbi:MAG TPA: protein translocase subunit SecF, partial [Bacillales bacterium]|nr:protein translocase subunit SecF [Bacillales bacterium]